MPLGLYISVPFCRTKCSYCNFASDVFSKSAYENYVARLLEDIASSRQFASGLGCVLEETADSIYLGGGTPSILEAAQLLRIFAAVRGQFAVTPDAEITVECAPGTLTPALIETLLQCGVNRVSLGVQSFVDREAQSVGRLHKRSIVLDEIRRLREAGLRNINIDLIAGLPHQTPESWAFSVSETIATGTPHVSVYMLEVDDDSRLGRELIAGGSRYHAHFVPDDDATADFYEQACEMLASAGIAQYEISNFARVVPASNNQSRHNSEILDSPALRRLRRRCALVPRGRSPPGYPLRDSRLARCLHESRAAYGDARDRAGRNRRKFLPRSAPQSRYRSDRNRVSGRARLQSCRKHGRKDCGFSR